MAIDALRAFPSRSAPMCEARDWPTRPISFFAYHLAISCADTEIGLESHSVARPKNRGKLLVDPAANATLSIWPTLVFRTFDIA